MQQPTVLCEICTKAFSRQHEVDNSYQHHETIESLRLAQETGCHMCSVIWEVARGDPSDMKWDFRQAAKLNVTYELSSSQSTIYFRLDSDVEKTASLMLTLRSISKIPSSSNSMPCPTSDIIQDLERESCPDRLSKCLYYSTRWLEDCIQNHTMCGISQPKISPSKLPTRVLDLKQQEKGYISLRETDGSEPGPYVTLSHRWSTYNEPPKLLKENIAERYECVQLASLPQSFKDSVHMAKYIGVRWLWIDSLCIIQDSADDWRAESSKMGDVYRNSFCNFAATGASQGHMGLFPGDSIVASPLFVNLYISKTGQNADPSLQCYRIEPWSLWSTKVEDAELNNRGWVVQERVLAPRTLHFTNNQVFWECVQNVASESIPDSLFLDLDRPNTIYSLMKETLLALRYPHDQASEQKNENVQSKVWPAWRQLTQSYLQCLLTKEEDRLIAISGIAKEIKNTTGDVYLAGHWRSTAITDLLWYNLPDGTRLARTRPLGAPTWSWASIKPYALVFFYQFQTNTQREHTHLVEFVEYDAQSYTDDDTGQLRSAILRLRGRLFTQAPITDTGSWRLPRYKDEIYIDGELFFHDATHFDEDEFVESTDSRTKITYMPVTVEPRGSSAGIVDDIEIHMLILIPGPRHGMYERVGMSTIQLHKSLSNKAFQSFIDTYKQAETVIVEIG